jgi:hypothetical protein
MVNRIPVYGGRLLAGMNFVPTIGGRASRANRASKHDMAIDASVGEHAVGAGYSSEITRMANRSPARGRAHRPGVDFSDEGAFDELQSHLHVRLVVNTLHNMRLDRLCVRAGATVRTVRGCSTTFLMPAFQKLMSGEDTTRHTKSTTSTYHRVMSYEAVTGGMLG